MSLHTVPPEKLGVPELWKKIRSFYPQLEAIQSQAHETDASVYTTASDEGGNGRFYLALLDDYYGEQFLDLVGTTSLSETLEHFIVKIQQYINDNPIFIDEEEDEEDEDD